jgi:hypothetical protein
MRGSDKKLLLVKIKERKKGKVKTSGVKIKKRAKKRIFSANNRSSWPYYREHRITAECNFPNLNNAQHGSISGCGARNERVVKKKKKKQNK